MQIHGTTVKLDPRDPAFYTNPYPYYDELRAKAPVFYWEEYDIWCLTRWHDVDALLRNRKFGRTVLHMRTREEMGWDPIPDRVQDFYDVELYSLLELEPPEHSRIRGLVQKAFMARQINHMRGRIADICDRLLDKMEDEAEVDVLSAYASTLPVSVIAEMLGVPLDMTDHLLDWSHAMVRMYQMGCTEADQDKAIVATRAFVSYLRDLIEERRKAPQDDLISQLVQVTEEGDRLTVDEMISTCILLLNAGHEATVNVMGNGLLALLKHPDQMAAWREDPGLTYTAIEELLRYDTPLHLFNRYSLADVEVAGQHFPFGSKIALLLGAANRDPAAFTNPNQLDLGREVNQHVSFGGGVHYCLGAPLARLELDLSLPMLLKRFPKMELAQEPTWQNSYHFHGLDALHVRLK